MGEEMPDGLLELVLPQLVGRGKTQRLREPFDLRGVPITMVELPQRHLLRELALGHSKHGTRDGSSSPPNLYWSRPRIASNSDRQTSVTRRSSRCCSAAGCYL